MELRGGRRDHLAHVARELDVKRSGTRLMFMMSSGGLTAANLFQGKDAILSGPAGGVVGLRPQVGRVERPLAIPGPVDLELHRLVGALGLGIADHLVAALLDVTAGRGIDGDPAWRRAADAGVAEDGQRLAGVADRERS